jgi:hypothetical protein
MAAAIPAATTAAGIATNVVSCKFFIQKLVILSEGRHGDRVEGPAFSAIHAQLTHGQQSRL